MSVLGSLGLATAHELARRVPPGMALRAYRALFGDDSPGVRAEAILGALRAAIALGAETELLALASFWSLQREAPAGAPVARLAFDLACQGRTAAALALARAEAERRPASHAAYLRARILDRAGAVEEARASYAQAAVLAGTGQPGAGAREAAIATAARARLLELALAGGAAFDAVAPLVAALEAARPLAPTLELLVGRARLRAPSKYARASGLSALAELAAGADPAVAHAALEELARAADALGRARSPLEAERIAAGLAHIPDGAARAAVLRELGALGAPPSLEPERAPTAPPEPREPAAERYLDLARSLVAGRAVLFEALAEDAGTLRPELGLAGAALHALAASALGDADATLRALDRTLALVPTAAPGPLPPAVWTALLVALGAPPLGVRKVAATLAELTLAPGRAEPPRGLLPYARALSLAAAGISADELGLATYRRAAERGESGAAAALGAELRSRALAAARAGRRLEAVALLREARAQLCVVPARPG